MDCFTLAGHPEGIFSPSHRAVGGDCAASTSLLGGLTSAIYNEVLQFFLIVAGFLPLVLLGLKNVGGWDGLRSDCTGCLLCMSGRA